MTTETKLEAKPLTPAQMDKLGREWDELDKRQEELDAEREKLAPQILACVELQGELAERAKKMRVATGREWELCVTASDRTSVDQKAAREFLLEVPKQFGELVFRREEKFVLMQTPDRLPGGAELTARARRLFQAALIVKPSKPSIDVRSRLAVQK
jgi:hypothetical protein